MKTHNRINTSPGRAPLITLTIDLNGKKQDKIGIYKDTDPLAEATKFVQRNRLKENMIQVIYTSIIKQMKAYDEMMVTYETQKETDYLHNLKQIKRNQLEQQRHIKQLSSKSQTPQKSRIKQHSPKLSPSPSFEDIPTDRVIIKRLFQLLDQDQDGLISQKKIELTKIPNKLKNTITQVLNQTYVPIEYEEFFSLIRNRNQDEYFDLLKQVSEILEITRIKVLL